MIFSRRVSSFFSLLLISLIAFVLGTVIIVKAEKLKALQEPIPFYIENYGR